MNDQYKAHLMEQERKNWNAFKAAKAIKPTTIKSGDQIKTTYGEWYTVIDIIDNIITVGGNQNTVHTSNVVKVISK